MPVLTSDNTHLSRPKTGPDLADFGPSEATWIEPAATVQDYLRAATSENTRRAYRADLRHFVDWGGTIPTTDVVVAEYIARHAGELAVSTLTRRLAAISKAHTAQGLPTPTVSDLVRTTMRGIKRAHGRPQRQVAAAVKEDVLAMVARMGNGPKDLRDRALILIGFAGAFRRSELVAINCTDVERVSRGVVVGVLFIGRGFSGRIRDLAIGGPSLGRLVAPTDDARMPRAIRAGIPAYPDRRAAQHRLQHQRRTDGLAPVHELQEAGAADTPYLRHSLR